MADTEAFAGHHIRLDTVEQKTGVNAECRMRNVEKCPKCLALDSPFSIRHSAFGIDKRQLTPAFSIQH
jgi:hypothetical protein